MLLDDIFEANKEAMKEDVKEAKEVDTKEYLRNINIDSVGKVAKKAVKTEFGYTMALATIGGIGLSVYFHSFAPAVFGLVSGVVTYSVLTIAEKTKKISFQA